MVDQVPPENATSMSLEGVTVHIKVDSQAAQVYKAETTVHPKGMKGYIESSEGKRFTVHVKSSFGADLSAKLYIDGEGISRYALHGSDPPERLRSFMGKKNSLTSIRSFVFQLLSLTDNIDIAVTDEAIVKNIGSIKLSICRVVLISRSPTRQYQTDFGGVASKVLHEQSKKATLSHAAGLGATEAAAAGEYFLQVDYIDNPTNPWLTFEFAYRSRDLLEIQGIIPTQAPVPAASLSNSTVQVGKKRPAPEVINIGPNDDGDDEAQAPPQIIDIDLEEEYDQETPEQGLQRLRAEVASFKKIKLESKVKEELVSKES